MLKLEVGKTYKDSNDSLVHIGSMSFMYPLSPTSQENVFHGRNMETYFHNGINIKNVHGTPTSSAVPWADLVEEIVEKQDSKEEPLTGPIDALDIAVKLGVFAKKTFDSLFPKEESKATSKASSSDDVVKGSSSQTSTPPLALKVGNYYFGEDGLCVKIDQKLKIDIGRSYWYEAYLGDNTHLYTEEGIPLRRMIRRLGEVPGTYVKPPKLIKEYGVNPPPKEEPAKEKHETPVEKFVGDLLDLFVRGIPNNGGK